MAAKYDTIGIDYNLTRRADPYLTEQLMTHLQPVKNGCYLDIGCGTGNYTNALHKKGVKFIGIDPSTEMLRIARSRNSKIDWRHGTAENTGLADDSLDGIIASLTIHHWTDLHKAFSELSRILKKDGTLVIFTSTPTQMKGYWLHHYFPKMMSDSMFQMPSLVHIQSAMRDAGFTFLGTETYAVHPGLEDKFLYCGKQHPELYLDDTIRNGISSFSAIASQEEVIKGVAVLRQDIQSCKIEQIITSYENDMGDYLYLIGKNPVVMNG